MKTRPIAAGFFVGWWSGSHFSACSSQVPTRMGASGMRRNILRKDQPRWVARRLQRWQTRVWPRPSRQRRFSQVCWWDCCREVSIPRENSSRRVASRPISVSSSRQNTHRSSSSSSDSEASQEASFSVGRSGAGNIKGLLAGGSGNQSPGRFLQDNDNYSQSNGRDPAGNRLLRLEPRGIGTYDRASISDGGHKPSSTLGGVQP